MKKNLPIIIAAVFYCQLAFSQNVVLSPTVIASAGNYSEAGGISLSWTLGEVAISTLQGGDIILTQGFQQAFDGNVGFNIDPIKWQILAYPNPVSDQLRIQFDMPETNDFIIEIQDVTGRIISQEQYKEVYPGDMIQVNMSSYQYGVYLFRISTTNRTQVRVISISKI
ncbi:MAG: T9SS type A sorting domain-containing protein [Bacteroidales bacterium]